MSSDEDELDRYDIRMREGETWIDINYILKKHRIWIKDDNGIELAACIGGRWKSSGWEDGVYTITVEKEEEEE